MYSFLIGPYKTNRVTHWPKGMYTLLSLVQIFGFFSSSFISTLKSKHWPSQEFSSLDGPKIGSFFWKEKSKKASLIFHWSIQMTNVFSLVHTNDQCFLIGPFKTFSAIWFNLHYFLSWSKQQINISYWFIQKTRIS